MMAAAPVFWDIIGTEARSAIRLYFAPVIRLLVVVRRVISKFTRPLREISESSARHEVLLGRLNEVAQGISAKEREVAVIQRIVQEMLEGRDAEIRFVLETILPRLARIEDLLKVNVQKPSASAGAVWRHGYEVHFPTYADGEIIARVKEQSLRYRQALLYGEPYVPGEGLRGTIRAHFVHTSPSTGLDFSTRQRHLVQGYSVALDVYIDRAASRAAVGDLEGARYEIRQAMSKLALLAGEPHK